MSVPALDWYYSIELAPGEWTAGKDLPAVALTRHILRNCAVDNSVCLDIGAMDGLVSVLLARRGAKRVVACDRYDRSAQIEAVTRRLGVKFDYLPLLTLTQTRDATRKVIANPFDLIVFSGVLYHMYDPMVGLALVRSMVRTGGLVVVESYAVASDLMTSYFNAYGNIEQDPHNYWNMSIPLLDYLLRFFRLQPLDCSYFVVPGTEAQDGSKMLRICVPCRAVDASLAEPNDVFMSCAHRDDDAEFPIWPDADTAPLAYASGDGELPLRETGAVDLQKAVQQKAPLIFGANERRLPLTAHF